MNDKTAQDAAHRLSQLRAIFEKAELSLSLSAELDAIQNHGVDGWNDYLRRRAERKNRRRS